jgi:hypothetical protein
LPLQPRNLFFETQAHLLLFSFAINQALFGLRARLVAGEQRLRLG